MRKIRNYSSLSDIYCSKVLCEDYAKPEALVAPGGDSDTVDIYADENGTGNPIKVGSISRTEYDSFKAKCNDTGSAPTTRPPNNIAQTNSNYVTNPAFEFSGGAQRAVPGTGLNEMR